MKNKIIGYLDYVFMDAIKPTECVRHMSRGYDLITDKFLLFDANANAWIEMPHDWQYLNRIVENIEQLKDLVICGAAVGVLSTKEVYSVYDTNNYECTKGQLAINTDFGDEFIVRYIIENGISTNGKLIYTTQGWMPTGNYSSVQEIINTEVAIATEHYADEIKMLKTEIAILKEGGNI